MNTSTIAQVSTHGFKFTLNVSVKAGLDWTGKAPKWVHYCLIEVGECEQNARAKAATIQAAMGPDYKFSLRGTPNVASYNEDL